MGVSVKDKCPKSYLVEIVGVVLIIKLDTLCCLEYVGQCMCVIWLPSSTFEFLNMD